jgi:steroid delta-isomerase-like uncharacterized protein
MSQDSKDVVRRLYALLDSGNLDGLRELLSDALICRYAGIPAPFDKQGFVGFLEAFRAAFPDMQHSLDRQIAEGDRVVTSLTFRGTHRGDLQGISASGRRVEVRAFNIHRIVAGRIVEGESVVDMLSLMQQIGAIPTPNEAKV